jgi:hypothetical protein
MPDKYKPPYLFSTHIGTACNVKSRTFVDLAEKLKMPVDDLIRQVNGKTALSKALVKGLSRELDMQAVQGRNPLAPVPREPRLALAGVLRGAAKSDK